MRIGLEIITKYLIIKYKYTHFFNAIQLNNQILFVCLYDDIYSVNGTEAIIPYNKLWNTFYTSEPLLIFFIIIDNNMIRGNCVPVI